METWKGILAAGNEAVSPIFKDIRNATRIVIANDSDDNTAVINLFVVYGGVEVRVIPKNTTIEAGRAYLDENLILMQYERFKLTSSGANVAYHFSMF